MSINTVLAYRARIAGLSERNARIWKLAHTMMNESMMSESADAQYCFKSSARHAEKMRQAEDELLALLEEQS